MPDLQVDFLICILSSPLPGGILDSVSGGRADLSRSQWLKAADFLALFSFWMKVWDFYFPSLFYPVFQDTRVTSFG